MELANQITPEEWETAAAIRYGLLNEIVATASNVPAGMQLCIALALLTSPVKANREKAKSLVRQWKRNGHQHIAENI
jgi:hypothetical protein